MYLLISRGVSMYLLISRGVSMYLLIRLEGLACIY